MESSPDKAQHCTLPDPIDDIIPQFDGGADEKDDSSPRKGISPIIYFQKTSSFDCSIF